MRHAHQPCEKHSRSYCSDSICKAEEQNSSDNMGSVSVNTDGGSGLAIDPSDGSIGIQIGSLTIDT